MQGVWVHNYRWVTSLSMTFEDSVDILRLQIVVFTHDMMEDIIKWTP